MSTVIDEHGNRQAWTAVYWRHHQRYEHAADSIEAAIYFLSYGEEEGTLSAVEVRGPDGQVVIAEEEIFDACYGYNRWAPERKAQTLLEIGGGPR